MLRLRPLLIVPLEDVHNFLQILYPSKVSLLPANREGIWYIVNGNHRFTACCRLGIKFFYYQPISLQSLIRNVFLQKLTPQILRELEMADNIIESKTITGVSTLQKNSTSS